MTSKHYGIEDARKILGDLITAAQQGTDIIITRNRRPVARITAYQEDTMITLAQLADELGLTAADAEKVARFAGAFEQHDPRTGRLPKRWAGQGMFATFSRDEADELIAEWHRAAAMVEAGAILPYINEAETEAARQELAERYRTS